VPHATRYVCTRGEIHAAFESSLPKLVKTSDQHGSSSLRKASPAAGRGIALWGSGWREAGRLPPAPRDLFWVGVTSPLLPASGAGPSPPSLGASHRRPPPETPHPEGSPRSPSPARTPAFRAPRPSPAVLPRFPGTGPRGLGRFRALRALGAKPLLKSRAKSSRPRSQPGARGASGLFTGGRTDTAPSASRGPQGFSVTGILPPNTGIRTDSGAHASAAGATARRRTRLREVLAAGCEGGGLSTKGNGGIGTNVFQRPLRWGGTQPLAASPAFEQAPSVLRAYHRITEW